jgi:hypothetical protein
MVTNFMDIIIITKFIIKLYKNKLRSTIYMDKEEKVKELQDKHIKVQELKNKILYYQNMIKLCEDEIKKYDSQVNIMKYILDLYKTN